MAEQTTLAAVTVHPLPRPSGPPRPPPGEEHGGGGPTCVGWFAKLRGTLPERQAAAAAAAEATTAAAPGTCPSPPPRSVHTPVYSFVFNATSTLAPLRPPACPTDLSEGYPDGYESPAGYRVGVEEVALAAGCAGVDVFEEATDARDDGHHPRPLIVTYRNNLNKVIGTAFKPGDEWAVDAVALEPPARPGARPVVFLDIVNLPSASAWEAGNPDADRFTYWGYKFEALCAAAAAGADGSHAWSRSGEPPARPPPARHGRSEWASLLRRRLGPVDVLFAAETDGFCPDLAVQAAAAAASPSSGRAPVIAPGTPPVPLAATVEVKTLKWPASPGAAAALHRRKVPTWWLQAWLAGCGEVWAGGREADGTLTGVDRIPTDRLPDWSAGQGGAWCPAAIIDSGGRLLEWMAGVAASVPGQTVRFHFQPPRRKAERSWGGGGGGGGGGRWGGHHQQQQQRADGGGGRWVPPHQRGEQQRQQQQQQPGVLTARVVEGGDLGRRVRAAVEEGVLLP
jgi:hypothetical protein